MTHQRPLLAIDTRNGYAVSVPSATESLGRALRGAFDGKMALPDDMAAALSKLDHTRIR